MLRKPWFPYDFIQMPFKINISHKGKTYKLETESEVIVGKKIGEKIKGEDISNELDGYELQITGTSDISGIPGFKGLEGTAYHKRLLTYGPGMKDRRRGIRLRKTNRGEEISLKTSQVNTIIVKEGKKKFESLLVPKTGEEKPTEAPTEQAKSTKESTPKETSDTKETEKEKPKTEEAPKETKEALKEEEKKVEPTPNTSSEKPITDLNKKEETSQQ